ncbi:MAG: type II toxin-antitoxin system VapC family toxin [Actinomycetota bacterium]
MLPVTHHIWQAPYVAPGPVYLDSSVVIALLTSGDRFHPRAVQFLGDHLIAHVELHVSLLAVDETIWRMARGMVAQAGGLPIKSVNLGILLKNNPSLLTPHLGKIRQAISYVLTWATLAAPACTAGDLLESWLDRLADIGGVHDAQHLALAQHLGSRTLVTADSDFRQVKALPFPLTVLTL